MIAAMRMASTAAPAPIPAFAPVDNPLVCVSVFAGNPVPVALLDEVEVADVLLVEVELEDELVEEIAKL